LENAFREAVKAGTKAVDTDHIFPALLYDENGESAAAFRNVGVHLRAGQSSDHRIVESSQAF
jgi:hypothetical protein